MSASLGKSLQRSKRAAEQQSRHRYRALLAAEQRAAAAQQQQQQQQHEEEGNTARPTLQSIWQTNDLDDFLAIADARETGYFAERDVRVVVGGKVHVVKDNAVVPRAAQTPEEAARWQQLSTCLTIPRRPEWRYDSSAAEVQAAERAAFLQWRRSLAALEQAHHVCMTPYEKNLEVWRQLWRVVERADVVAVIVDARNPLVFRCSDFEAYVRSTHNRAGAAKQVVLLLNKADLLTEEQRQAWAAYFVRRHETFFFFSAKPADTTHEQQQSKECAHTRDDDEEDEDARSSSAASLRSVTDNDDDTAAAAAAAGQLTTHKADKSRHRSKALRAPVAVHHAYALAEQRRCVRQRANVTTTGTLRSREAPATPTPPSQQQQQQQQQQKQPLQKQVQGTGECATTQQPPRRQEWRAPLQPWTVLNAVQLLDCLSQLRRDAGVACDDDDNDNNKNTSKESASHTATMMVGLVGYPNVGKSSTINALLGAKKVTVSATPGKTKHFQTLYIPHERRVALCDCPGLVFPSFAVNAEEMVCNGVLPVDTATDVLAAVTVLCGRLPRALLERRLRVSLAAADDVDDSHSCAERLLHALARRRGYMASHDRPNKARAGKELLKLFVDGGLVYVEPPPSYAPSQTELAVTTDAAVARGTRTRARAHAAHNTVATTVTTTTTTGHAHDDDDDDDCGSEHSWNTAAEDEAWADLDSADEARALSDVDDDNDRHRSGSDDEDASERAACRAMFYVRPRGSTRHAYTRSELFNKQANEAYMVHADEQHAAELERRRRRRHAHAQLRAEGDDAYTFVNRDGEVELRIDDDDGVLELVHAPQVVGAAAAAAAAHTARTRVNDDDDKNADDHDTATTRPLTKRQLRRELKRSGVRVGLNSSKQRIAIRGYTMQ